MQHITKIKDSSGEMSNLFGKNGPFKRKVFYKLLISLISLTIIPIFFLGLTSYFVFYNSMVTQSEDYDRLLLRTISEKLDRDLEDVREIMYRYALFLDIDKDNHSRILNVVREFIIAFSKRATRTDSITEFFTAISIV
jgi:hypothetical protein